jgi:hypothetical protein
MSKQEITLKQAAVLIASLRDSLKSINEAFDHPFDDDIAQADAFLLQCSRGEEGASIATIGPWDSARYGHQENPHGPDFEVSVLDHLDRDGQVFVDIRPDGGNSDDLLSTMVEVEQHPETGQHVPVVRVYRGDDCIARVYADGMDKALLVLTRSDVQGGVLRIRED